MEVDEGATERKMNMRNVAMLAGMLMLAGCGLANERHAVSWRANSENSPDAECVRDALAAIPAIVRVQDESSGKGRQVLGLYLTKDDIYPEMRLIVAGPPDHLLRIVYGDYASFRSEREQAAHSILDGIGKACGLPDLPQRARESHDAEWSPYLFNI